MLTSFFILNHRGEVYIARYYRPETTRTAADMFRVQVATNPNVRSPINTIGDLTFFHIRHENLYLVATAKENVNAALVFEFLNKVVSIGESYFIDFDEEAVKSNFVLIYELLDEIVDYGYPQNNDVNSLKMYITTEGIKSEKALKEDSSKITIQATGVISWRRPDIKYRKNEAYLDVIESVNVLMSAKGTVLRSDVSGQILMRCFLSGMPDCKLGLNDKLLLDKREGGGGTTSTNNGGETGTNGTTTTLSRRNKDTKGKMQVELDDVQFHQCVKLGRFDTERSISFVPPDGEFELMRYRVTEISNLPFKVHPIVNEHKTRVEYKIAVKSQFAPPLFANGVVIRIPTPPNCIKANISVPIGKAKYSAGENAIVWKISRFDGDVEHILSAEAELSSMVVKKVWSRPPVSMEFQVMMFTSSGLNVQFLKVFEKTNYKSVKWVRYYTRGASYQFRF